MATLGGATLAAPAVRSGFLRNVALLAGASAAGQGLVLAATPILARLYSPADFGTLGICTAITSTMVVFACLRYEVAIALPDRDRDGLDLLALSLALALVAGILSVPAVALLRDDIARWTDTPALAGVLWFTPLAIFGGAAYQALTYWGVRKTAFAGIARTKLAQGSTAVTAQTGLGVAGVGAVGLVAGDLLSRTAGTVSLAGMALSAARAESWRPSRRAITSVAVHYRRFPLVGSISAVINVASLYLLAPLFSVLYSVEVAGWLGLGQRMIIGPSMLLGAAVAQVFMARAARLAHDDPAEGLRLFRATLKKLSVAAIVLGAAGFLLAPWGFSMLLGGEWREAGEFARYLSIDGAVALMVSPLSQIAFIANRQGMQLFGDIARLAIVVGAVAGAHAVWPLDPLPGVAAYTVAMVLTYAAFLAFYYRTAVALAAGATR